MRAHPVLLTRGRDALADVDAFAGQAGGRVGLGGVLSDLNRVATPAHASGRGVSWAFSWEPEDVHSPRWWPQGITSSGDASTEGTFAGRPVLITTSYAQPVGGVRKGARITVVDLSEEDQPRYRHVLLVRAKAGEDGSVDLAPLKAHAGGAAWCGRSLHVAGTGAGVYTFDLDDIVRVESSRPDLLGRDESGGFSGFGHRYLLPLRMQHMAGPPGSPLPMRYSFVSIGRESGRPFLLAGEYSSTTTAGRLARFALDPGSGSFAHDQAGQCRAELIGPGVPRMQGAVLVDGVLHLSTSRGRSRRGDLWSGAPGSLHRHAGALPVGPEDLCWWPARDTLWTLSEYPSMRFVVALPRPEPA